MACAPVRGGCTNNNRGGREYYAMADCIPMNGKLIYNLYQSIVAIILSTNMLTTHFSPKPCNLSNFKETTTITSTMTTSTATTTSITQGNQLFLDKVPCKNK